MPCEHLRDSLADYLAGAMRAGEAKAVEAHLAGCEDCRSAVRVWRRLGDLSNLAEETPRRAMRSRFDEMLRRESRPRVRWQPWALAAGLLIAGFLGGRFAVPTPAPERGGEVAALRNEVRNLREAVIVSMLRQDSATERLKGIQTTASLDRPDSEVVAALIDTLRRDRNVNVRLAAVDALKRFASEPAVRRGFTESLAAADSPLVQIALIEALVESRDGQAAEALRRLESDDSVDNLVRQRAQLAVERLKARHE
jgi:hypothetical protein